MRGLHIRYLSANEVQMLTWPLHRRVPPGFFECIDVVGLISKLSLSDEGLGQDRWSRT